MYKYTTSVATYYNKKAVGESEIVPMAFIAAGTEAILLYLLYYELPVIPLSGRMAKLSVKLEPIIIKRELLGLAAPLVIQKL